MTTGTSLPQCGRCGDRLRELLRAAGGGAGEQRGAGAVSYTHLSIVAELTTALFVSSAGMVLKLGIASVALTGSVLLLSLIHI